jgi:hypothetical protein
MTAPPDLRQAMFLAVNGVDGMELSKLLARTNSAFKLRTAGVLMADFGVLRILRGVTIAIALNA